MAFPDLSDMRFGDEKVKQEAFITAISTRQH